MQRNARKLRYGILIADTVWIAAAFAVSCTTNAGSVGPGSKLLSFNGADIPILASSILAWWVIYWKLTLNGFRRGWQWGNMFSEIAVGVAMLAGVVSAFAFLIHDLVARSTLFAFLLLLGAGFASIRTMLRIFLSSIRSRPSRRVVIIGNGKIAQELSFKLQNHPEMRCEVVGLLYPGEARESESVSQQDQASYTVQDLGALELLRDSAVTDVMLALSDEHGARSALALLAKCREAGMRVSVVPRTYELYASRPNLMDFDGLPVLSLDNVVPDRFAAIWKRLFDIASVLLTLPITAPLLLAATAYTKAATGDALRRELRCGQDGRLFVMYRLNVGRERSAGFIQRGLIEMGLAELPQLWNVLRGEMSLVGPRPESPERVRCYSEWQRQRLRVRPGLTGLAQVHGLREENSTEDKARFDLQYILSFGPLLDSLLVVETLWTLLARLFVPRRASICAVFKAAPGALGEPS